MVETINPVVHGARRSRWAIDVGLHVAGATLAAAAFGAALGGLGALLGAPWGRGGPLLVALIAVIYAAGEVIGRRLPVPQARRQVPDWWRTFFSRPAYAFLYGVGLGVGFFTYLARGTLVAVSAAVVATGRPLIGALFLAPFGAARGASVLVASRVRDTAAATALVDRLVAGSRSWVWRAANALALLGVAAAATYAAVDATGSWTNGLAPAVLAAAFGWAAISKILRPRSWRATLDAHEIPPSWARIARVLVPASEIGVAALVLTGMRVAAGVGALALLVMFSAAVVRARRRLGTAVPCGCFGGRRTIDARLLLARNVVLAGVAALVAAGGDAAPRISLPPWPTGPGIVPALLGAVALGIAAWVGHQVALAARTGRRG
jgi:putative oxidoreductase